MIRHRRLNNSVESADVAFDVGLAARHAAGAVRGAHDYGIAGYDRSGMQPDLARHQIDLLVIFELQVDHPGLADPCSRI